VIVMAAVGIGGCAMSNPPSRASLAARSACRARADEVFQQQNRGAIYREDNFVSGLRDTPFGSAGLGSALPNGLSDQFGRDRTMQACLDGIGTQSAPDTTTDAAPASK
jgi:hypothetical protein